VQQMKRGKQKRILAAILAAVCILTACTPAPSAEGEKRYTASYLDVFDTRTEIAGYGESEEAFRLQADQIKEQLAYYHKLYDIYHTYEGINNLKTINDNAGIAPVKVDAEIIALMKLSKEMYELTAGKVNIAMGSVLSLWHDYRERGANDPKNAKLPPMERLQEAAMYTDIDQLIIDEEASTVYLADPRMRLDVGGIGKGYAVQKAAEYAREQGADRLLISVGGNVAAIGEKSADTPWKIGITDPDMQSNVNYAETVYVKDRCIVTSGNYQRYYEVDGIRYCHIIDPATLMPADHFTSVTIITADSGVADALSTAVFTLPLEEGMAFVNGLDGVEAMWITEEGEIHYSDGFVENYLEKE